MEIAFTSWDGRIVGGPASVAADVFNRFDEHVKAWRWELFQRGITVDLYGWKRCSRTGELV